MYHPIFHSNRVATIKMIDEMGGMSILVGQTVSCYNGTPACGYCKPCVDRKAAFDEYAKQI
jgi:7-cyano-7-deazaguanine synthase in queuosine biosynthesis